MEEEHCHRVVEQPQDEDGVDAVGSAGEEEEEVGREAEGLGAVGRRERRGEGEGVERKGIKMQNKDAVRENIIYIYTYYYIARQIISKVKMKNFDFFCGIILGIHCNTPILPFEGISIFLNICYNGSKFVKYTKSRPIKKHHKL